MGHELGEIKKNSRKHTISDSFREVVEGSFEPRYGCLRRFSNENFRFWLDSAAKPVLRVEFLLKTESGFAAVCV